MKKVLVFVFILRITLRCEGGRYFPLTYCTTIVLNEEGEAASTYKYAVRRVEEAA